MEKKNIRLLSKDELKQFVADAGEPAFRVKQIEEWLWQKGARNFEEMTSLSKNLRQKLSEKFTMNTVEVKSVQKSEDGTIKMGLHLEDGNFIEAVLIPQGTRMTACISSQVGCSLDCRFCATAALKRIRNLTYDEIYDQVVLVHEAAKEHFDLPLTNIVFMGMGEPLLNYANMMKAIEKITSPNGLGMSPRRITVSTAGIAKMIKKLADDGARFNLALSLHAPNDEKRNRIMSINETNSLRELKRAMVYYHETTKMRPTFEYVLLRDFNDTFPDAEELAEFCKCVPCKINLIEYNPIDGGEFKRSPADRADAFEKKLRMHRLNVSIRRSRGKDIDAACGQLANKVVEGQKVTA